MIFHLIVHLVRNYSLEKVFGKSLTSKMFTRYEIQISNPQPHHIFLGLIMSYSSHREANSKIKKNLNNSLAALSSVVWAYLNKGGCDGLQEKLC
uniref:Uncharacterized protein n=1 Tax=Cyprinus carpio carpio TaxID=630221 RepID=A0A9J8D9L3_CYPCA